MIRKICVVFLTVALCVFSSGCPFPMSRLERFSQLYDYEKQIFQDKVHDFWDAVDAGDKDAIKALFSSSARSQAKCLDDQIDALLEIYHGPADLCTCEDALIESGTRKDNGKVMAYCRSVFPVISDEAYFWCDIKLVYENDMDEAQIGISRILFFTEEAYCCYRYSDYELQTEEFGLTVYAQEDPDRESRTVGGYPYWFTDKNNKLNASAVVNHLNVTSRYSDFIAEFGEPCAENIYYIYQLEDENGEVCYLEVGVDERTDTIYGVSVVSDLKWLRKLWGNE